MPVKMLLIGLYDIPACVSDAELVSIQENFEATGVCPDQLPFCNIFEGPTADNCYRQAFEDGWTGPDCTTTIYPRQESNA